MSLRASDKVVPEPAAKVAIPVVVLIDASDEVAVIEFPPISRLLLLNLMVSEANS